MKLIVLPLSNNRKKVHFEYIVFDVFEEDETTLRMIILMKGEVEFIPLIFA